MPSLLLLDLDGTLIDTPHYEAWRNAGDRVGASDLTREEYLIFISGRPRREGAACLLKLKQGMRGDLCNPARVAMLAEIKQKEFLRLSSHARFFDDAWRLLERTQATQQRVGFYTASQNAPCLFETALHQSGLRLNRRASVVQQQSGQTREALFLHLSDGYDLDNVTLVDDSPYAVDTACLLGIHAYQICRDEIQALATDSRTGVLSSLDAIAVPIRNTT